MANFSVLQQGHIYFFYRSKQQNEEAHSLEEVQRFFMILKPENQETSTMVVIGRKHLPEMAPYFSFIKKSFDNNDELVKFLIGTSYMNENHAESNTVKPRCVAEGKYLLLDHDRHTHLCYQLELSTEMNDIQKQFRLETYGDYLITVKNPSVSSPNGIGLSSDQKAEYSRELMDKFGSYRFIPLNPAEFLNYEGAEFLIIDKGESDIQQHDDIEKCLNSIQQDFLTEYFQKINIHNSLSSILKGS